MRKETGYVASSYSATFEPSTFLLDLHRKNGQTILDVEDLNSGQRFVISTERHIREEDNDNRRANKSKKKKIKNDINGFGR